MADPVAILDAKAREMFEAFVGKQDGRWTLRAWVRGDNPRPSWDNAPNHTREEWRTKASLVISGKERLSDVLRREERELRAQLSERGAKCGHVQPLARLSCELPAGHDGLHSAKNGAVEWSTKWPVEAHE